MKRCRAGKWKSCGLVATGKTIKEIALDLSLSENHRYVPRTHFPKARAFDER